MFVSFGEGLQGGPDLPPAPWAVDCVPGWAAACCSQRPLFIIGCVRVCVHVCNSCSSPHPAEEGRSCTPDSGRPGAPGGAGELGTVRGLGEGWLGGGQQVGVEGRRKPREEAGNAPSDKRDWQIAGGWARPHWGWGGRTVPAALPSLAGQAARRLSRWSLTHVAQPGVDSPYPRPGDLSSARSAT